MDNADKFHLIAKAKDMYFSQIKDGEKDLEDTLTSFMLHGFKGFNNMTQKELEEWIEISS